MLDTRLLSSIVAATLHREWLITLKEFNEENRYNRKRAIIGKIENSEEIL